MRRTPQLQSRETLRLAAAAPPGMVVVGSIQSWGLSSPGVAAIHGTQGHIVRVEAPSLIEELALLDLRV